NFHTFRPPPHQRLLNEIRERLIIHIVNENNNNNDNNNNNNDNNNNSNNNNNNNEQHHSHPHRHKSANVREFLKALDIHPDDYNAAKKLVEEFNYCVE